MSGPITGWRKSSFSGGSGAGSCVEVASTDDVVLVRNSNRIGEGLLAFDPNALAAFVAGCKTGEFDDLAR